MTLRVNSSTTISLIIIATIWAVFCSPWLIDGKIIPYDAKNHFYPMVRFVAAALHGSQSAFWSPYHYGGFPMLADPQSVIMTPSLWPALFFTATPSMHLVDAIQLLHLLVIGFAIFAFGKGQRWTMTAAIVAALIAMMGGVITFRLEHVLMTVSMMWLCVSLWRLDVLIRKGGWWRGVAFGLPLAVMLIDRDHVAYLGAWFLLCYWLVRIVPEFHHKDRYQTAKHVAPVILGGGMALMIAIVPILLLLQLAENSNRPNFGLATASWQSLHPAALATFFFSEYFGPMREFGSYWGPAGARWGGEKLIMHRGMLHLYMGVLPVILIFWDGIVGRQLLAKGNRFFTLCALFFLLYALGRYTPLFAYLYDFVPGVDLFRRPADGLFLFGLAISLLTGSLLDRAVKGQRNPANRLSEIIFVVVVAAILYFVTLMAVEREQVQSLLSSLTVFIIIAAVVVCCLLCIRRFPNQKQIICGILVLTVSGDLIVHMSGINGNARPKDFYQALEHPEQHPALARLSELVKSKDPSGVPWRVEIVGLGPAFQNIAQVAHLQNLLGYNPINLRGFVQHIGPDMQNSAANRRKFGDMMTSYDSALANQLGLKYIMTDGPLEKLDTNLTGDGFKFSETLNHKDREIHIFENDMAEPRVTVMTKEGAELRNSARVEHYGHSKIRIIVTSQEDADLILRDFHYPGWEATVDGIKTPIELHDNLFRRVAIPKGESEIIFHFNLVSIKNLKSIASDLAFGVRDGE